MGRLILLILLIIAIVIVWKAFGPGTWNKNRQELEAQRKPQIKGPDDDENFLWELEKNRFKQRRAQEEAARQEQERISRAQRKYGTPPPPAEEKADPTKKLTEDKDPSPQEPPQVDRNPEADPDKP